MRVSSLLYSAQTNARIRKWRKRMEVENKWQRILSDCYNYDVEFRRGLAYYNLGMQKDAWNDLTQWMGSAPHYVRQQLASPNGFDLFRLHLNPEVLMTPGHTPLSNLLSSMPPAVRVAYSQKMCMGLDRLLQDMCSECQPLQRSELNLQIHRLT